MHYESCDAEPVTVEFKYIQHQTDKAWLLVMESSSGLVERWVPKSLCTMVNATSVRMPAWLAAKLI